jgi:type IV secretory pathway TrbF-like protein
MLTPSQSKRQLSATTIAAGTLPETTRLKDTASKSEQHNPYLAGRREWDERYGELAARVKNANRIALICAAIALLETPAFIVMALRPPKVIVVAVNSAGQYVGSGVSGRPIAVTEDMKRSTLSE